MADLDHLSYSSISTYQLCPRSWRYRYLDRIKTPTASALALGSAVHGTVEQMITDKHLGLETDVQAAWHTHWERASAQEIDWDGDSPEIVEAEGLRLVSTREVRQLVDKLAPLVIGGVPFVEQRVELRVPGVPLPIIGYIDIVTADGVPGDFKTAARSWTQDKAESEVQPLFYLAALNQARAELPPALPFRHYVLVKTKTPQVQIIETRHTSGALFWLFGAIADVWHGIEAEVFPPNPTSWKCGPKYCEYFRFCRGRIF